MRPAEYHCRIRGPMVEVAARPQLPAQTNDMQALVAAALRNLRLWAEADRAQAGLWVPAIFGAGAAAYLLSPREPSFGFAVFGLFAGVAVSVYWARAPAGACGGDFHGRFSLRGYQDGVRSSAGDRA